MGNLQVAGVSTRRVGRWVAVHEELTLLARRRSALDGLEGPALLRGLRAGVHRHLGMASFGEYVERLFGYSRRTLDDKLRTAEALEALPELARALRDGEVTWSAVRELARVATGETEREWLDAARGRTAHDVERLVSGQRRGARPTDEPDVSQQRHTLRFEVSAETLATFREAMRALRLRAGGPLEEDSALLLMAREVLGGPADEGRSSYQVALNVCERCGLATQEARGEVIAVDEAVVAMARCDAQHLGRVAAPPCTNEDTHVGATDKTAVATQSIPPAVRRRVLRRDHGRCVVPGCRHATFVDVHHVEPRAEGGGHDADNLVVLCSAHHRALHRGQLAITGSVARGLAFHRSDGALYGALHSPRDADACTRAFSALRHLGFGERQSREAIQRAGTGDTESVVRRALAVLTASSRYSAAGSHCPNAVPSSTPSSEST